LEIRTIPLTLDVTYLSVPDLFICRCEPKAVNIFSQILALIVV